MLKDNWEEKHGIDIPAHTNTPRQPIQRFSNNDRIAESSNSGNVATLTSSGSNFDFRNQFHQQNHISETRKPIDNVSNQIEASADQSLVNSNLQELIKVLSANYGPMKTPLETGTPEYRRIVEILLQNSVKPNNENGYFGEELFGETKNKLSVEQDEKRLTSEKSTRVGAEKLWDGSLQLSSSVTLSAVAFFKSGEKLVGNNWPVFIEVKGKVRLEAFEKYVQDLPRSRNRGLMVTSICWNEGSSNIGLNGMKEVTKGYKKSCRVGFAQLLSGIDLYICPRSDPIITILAKYGFFKGMAVIDDSPDSMIGCVVWRKNRPHSSPPGFSTKTDTENKKSPEKPPPESSQPLTLTLPLTSEVDHNVANSSSSNNSVNFYYCNLVKKRPFEDDDLPEFDFGKSTLVSKPLVDSNSVVNIVDGSLEKSTKKTKLFDDEDDDDMPEWCPPELHHKLPPPPPPPPLPPFPPPPRCDTRPSFSYQPFRPGICSPAPPMFVRPPPPLPPQPRPLPSNQRLWRHPGSFNVNPPFPPSM